MGKLPNDGSADPLAAIYDVDLAIPADKVVRIFLIISKIKKMALRWVIMVVCRQDCRTWQQMWLIQL